MKVGIIGAGSIAAKMALTLSGIESCHCYAIASRDNAKAQVFADTWGCTRAYGSYEELVSDPDVDLVYIATPHSHHFEHAKLAIEHGKPCLVEKSFTANARQAEELLALAHEKKVFITEALWTRYQPIRAMIQEVLDSGKIGTPQLLTTSLCYPIPAKERLIKPELCGGALLDLGVYCINFLRMFFPDKWQQVHNFATLSPSGVDTTDNIVVALENGLVASMQASFLCSGDNRAFIRGSQGYLEIDNVNNPKEVKIYYGRDLEASEVIYAPDCPTGYEYEVLACEEALAKGWLEHPAMPHEETLKVMRLMDRFRADCGIKFPMD